MAKQLIQFPAQLMDVTWKEVEKAAGISSTGVGAKLRLLPSLWRKFAVELDQLQAEKKNYVDGARMGAPDVAKARDALHDAMVKAGATARRIKNFDDFIDPKARGHIVVIWLKGLHEMSNAISDTPIPRVKPDDLDREIVSLNKKVGDVAKALAQHGL